MLWQSIMSQSTLDYLKKRYLELEKEITTASLHGYDLIVADLRYRKLVIADEIQRASNEDVLSDWRGASRRSENMLDKR